MSSINIQNSIRQNSEEVQDFLRDLKHWENDIKKEDVKLSKTKNSSPNPCAKEASPVRKKKMLKNNLNMEKVEKIPKPSRISSYDYEGWSKFDVEKALCSDSEEEVEIKKEMTKIGSRNQEGKETLNNVNNERKDMYCKEERAERLKEEGNLCYSEGKLSDAVAKYTQGIGLDPLNPLLSANRAMAYIKLKKYKAAEKDCSRALQLDPAYIKAYLRRATARANISNITGAINDYEEVLKLEPWNKDAKKELEKLKSEIKPNSNTQCLERGPTKPLGKVEAIESINNNVNILEKDASKSQTISKLPYIQSQRPLVNIPVVEVNSRKDLTRLLKKSNNERKEPIQMPSEEYLAKSTKDSSIEKIENPTLVLPSPPRTSHQFYQDWRKVNKHEEFAISYLKNISPAFFHGTEIEVDQMIEVIGILCSNAFENEAAASISLSLMKSRGFFLNLAFLMPEQRKAIEQLVSKIESCEIVREDLKLLKDSLL